jgi:membrane dipeptidase
MLMRARTVEGVLAVLVVAAAATVVTSVAVTARAGAAPAAPSVATAAPGGDVDARARRLHASAIVVDTHVDVPDELHRKWADIGVPGATRHFDIPRARAGGLTAPFFAVYVPATYAETGGATRYTLEIIDLVRRVVAAHPADLVAATTPADIRRAKKDGRIAVLMGIEGGHAIEDSLAALRQFQALGVRYMTLTHTNTNHWADSTGPFYMPDYDPAAARVHDGLSDFGREVVREMNRIGMLVDVSHVSDATLADVLETSRAPVFASHSSCRALSNIPRNLTDDQIRSIAAKGGVVMINIGSYFLDQETVDTARAENERIRPEYLRIKTTMAADPQARDKAIGDLLEKLPRRRTSWTHAVDHIEHVIAVAGPGAVGLGSDFDGIQDPPVGLDDVSMLPHLTAELLRRGHSEADVRGFLGENFLRFFEKALAVSASLASEPPSTALYAPPAN